MLLGAHVLLNCWYIVSLLRFVLTCWYVYSESYPIFLITIKNTIWLELIEYRIFYRTRVMYDLTRLSLGRDSISLNVQRTWKLSIQNENSVVLNENSTEGKTCMNRESKSLYITIYLYSCYDINVNLLAVVTPAYIYHGWSTWKTFLEEKFTG